MQIILRHFDMRKNGQQNFCSFFYLGSKNDHSFRRSKCSWFRYHFYCISKWYWFPYHFHENEYVFRICFRSELYIIQNVLIKYVWMDVAVFCHRLNLKTVVDKLLKVVRLICTTNISKRAQGFFKILSFTIFIYFYHFWKSFFYKLSKSELVYRKLLMKWRKVVHQLN